MRIQSADVPGTMERDGEEIEREKRECEKEKYRESVRKSERKDERERERDARERV